MLNSELENSTMSMLATTFARNSRIMRASHGFLTEDQLRGLVPSIYADAPHESRSARYSYVPTSDVVAGLAKEGFRPTFACQAKSRIEGKSEFTKHMLRFRHERDMDRGGEVAETILINSHDGTSSYQLLGGVFRFVCQNGMVVGDKYDEIRLPHKGNIVNDVIEGVYSVVETLDHATGTADTMKQLTLARPEQIAFAEAAAILRFDLESGERSPVSPEQFLQPRRAEDRSSDLWTTFNRIQENSLRGGLHGKRYDENNRPRRMTTRPIGGIDQNIALNRGLWTLAERMAELKAA
jgi:hypothetical protein